MMDLHKMNEKLRKKNAKLKQRDTNNGLANVNT